MLKPDIKIIRQSEDRRYDTAGKACPFIRVTFMVGEHGPFEEKIDKADFTQAKRDTVLESFAQMVRTT